MATLQPRGPLAPVFVEAMTHDPEELRAIAQDPLHNRGPLLNRTGNQIWKACQRLNERIPHYALPFLALHGARDSVTYPSGSQTLFDGAGSATKGLKFYPNLYHELFLETPPERAAVLADVTAFLGDLLRDPKKNPHLSLLGAVGGAGAMDARG
jgi:acylglycerol lipase